MMLKNRIFVNGSVNPTRFFGLLLILVLSILTIFVLLVFAHSIDTPFCTTTNTYNVCTDKQDYTSESIVHISGSGFEANENLQIKVIRPDGLVVTGDGTFATWPTDYDNIITNAEGKFQYDYILDGILGTYTIEVLDPENNVIATHSFSDADIHFSQCSNDQNDDNIADPCNWVEGSLNQNNAIYIEGDVVAQRLFHKIDTVGSHTMRIRYEFTKASKYAYDFLSSPEITQSGGNFNACGQLPGFISAITCNSLFSGALTATIPSDSFDSVAARETPITREIKIGGVTSPSVSIVGHNPSTSCFQNCGDSDVEVDITFTTSSPDQIVAVWLGGHLARGGTNSDEWGTGFGSSTISGAPFHLKYISLDDGSVGNRDNQIQSGAIALPDTTSVATQIHLDNDHDTDVQSTTIALGSTIHDKATVTNTGSGGFGIPEGIVIFQFFNNGDCSGSPTATSSALALSSGSVDATGFAQGPLAAGSYSFLATYTTNDITKWQNSVSPCELVSVDKAQTSIGTAIHQGSDHATDIQGTSVPSGTSVHDSAMVSDSIGSFAITGTVTYMRYTSIDCNGLSTDETVAVGSESSTFTTTGVPLSYQATYNGDSNYESSTSSCEPLKATPVVTTDIHDANHNVVTSIPAGLTVHDEATVIGGTTPTGSVDFTFYTSNDCTIGGSASGTSISLISGVAHPSSSQGPLNAGSYSFKAHYNGDSNYGEADSACEPLGITKLTPTVVTTLHNDGDHSVIALGGEASEDAIHDSATVSGSFGTPTGSVTFTFYTDSICSTSAISKGTVNLDGSGISHPSDAATGLIVGHYSFKAHYNGEDQNYEEADSDCEDFFVTTLTINKLTTGGDETFGFTITGPTTSTPSITTSSGSGTTGAVIVTGGTYYIKESIIPSGWSLTTASCDDGSSTFSNDMVSGIVIAPGDAVVCTFENEKQLLTRTQGFWQTHYYFTKTTLLAMSSSDRNIDCAGNGIEKEIDTIERLMGGFWANIAKQTSGLKRSGLDRARMQLVQQLLAAMLNKQAFGTSDGGLIAAGKAAYCGDNVNAILSIANNLDAFNKGGDTIPITVNPGPATPKLAKSTAEKGFWNSLP